MKKYYEVLLTVKIIHSCGDIDYYYEAEDFDSYFEAKKVADDYMQYISFEDAFCNWGDDVGYLEDVIIEQLTT